MLGGGVASNASHSREDGYGAALSAVQPKDCPAVVLRISAWDIAFFPIFMFIDWLLIGLFYFHVDDFQLSQSMVLSGWVQLDIPRAIVHTSQYLVCLHDTLVESLRSCSPVSKYTGCIVYSILFSCRSLEQYSLDSRAKRTTASWRLKPSDPSSLSFDSLMTRFERNRQDWGPRYPTRPRQIKLAWTAVLIDSTEVSPVSSVR